MLSLSPPKSAGGAMTYFSSQLVEESQSAPEDYYSNSHEQPGRWSGKAATALGLAGVVDGNDFARTLLGYGQNFEKLVQNAGNSERRAGQDLTFSAPKSVSVAWALTENEALKSGIEQAQRRAVDKALERIEGDYLFTRRGHGGQDRERAEMIAAVFDHQTSREQDPQLHSHCFVMNVCRREDGSFGTIDNSTFYKIQKELGAYYRVELANEMQQLGLEVERDDDSFRLSNIDPRLEKNFSKRREQIESKLAEVGSHSARASETAALDTRKDKEHLSGEALEASWRAQAAALGITHDNLFSHEPEADDDAQPPRMPTHEEILSELTQHASTVSQHQLKAAVYIAAQGILDADAADQYLYELLADDELIRLRDARNEPRFTSREMLEIEQRLARNAAERQNEQHQVSYQALQQARAAFPTLSDEQKNMLAHVTGQAGVSCVQGMAGTGKSFALAAAREAWEADGKTVIGCALAGKAAAGLEDGSGIKSQTLHSLLHQLDEGQKQLHENMIIVVDEAGMVGSRQLDTLMQYANSANSKVVLVGDSRQLQPIDAGGGFRLISEKIGAAKLTDIRRQRQGWHREAVHQFADGQAGRALQQFNERGLVHVRKEHEQVIKQLAQNYLDDLDPARPGETLMIAGTRRDVALLNKEARQQLIDAGRLDNGESVISGGHEYCPGDRILFTRNSKLLDVKNGDLATLTHIEETADGILFHAETDSGGRVAWNPEDYEHFNHGYAVTAHKSQGVTVDHAHVLIHDGMSDREWSYVAASRSREATHLYCTEETHGEAEGTMSRSRQADTTQDYEREVPEMAQIPALNEDISEAELEQQVREETARLAEPDGFADLLDEIRNDEKEDQQRRKQLMEMQKQKEDEEEKNDEQQLEVQVRLNEAAAEEVEAAGFDDAEAEQAAREPAPGTEMEVE